jgi:hypothetical protein
MAKRFRISQLELRRGDQCDKEIGHERLPWGGTTLVGALSDGAEEGEHGASYGADSDDDGRARTRLNPRVIVFLEGDVEDLVGCLDAQTARSQRTRRLRMFLVRVPRATTA